MPVHDGARQEQKRLATALSLTAAQIGVKSGADIAQADLALKASTTVGPGKDGAYLQQLAGGSGA
jgi:hypothetical protein